MKKFLLTSLLSLSTVSLSQAALFSLSGNHRFGTNWFYNLDTIDGKNTGASDSTSYLEHRLIVRPDIIIDERFSIRSELSLISQNSFDTVGGAANQPGNVNQAGGAALDTSAGSSGSKAQNLLVRAAYLKWNSDIGVFKAGRMHKGWGLGLMYDEGMGVEDDSATIVDRMSFEGQLGSLVLTAAFEKYEEGSIYQDIDDEEVYEGSVRYENEGAGAYIGLLYGRHIRLADSASKVAGYSSSNEFSIFGKKEWTTFSVGGEFASVAYDSQSDVYGALAKMRWTPGNWELEADGLYSSESNGRAFLVNPNYRPFLILFRQSLGTNVGAASGTRYGRGIGFDPSASVAAETGAALGRVGFFYNFSQKKYRLGLVGGYAQMLNANASNSKNLGYEADIHFDQKWYDNFKTSFVIGALKTGDAFKQAGKGGPEVAWGTQIRSYLSF
ncbi:MAG: hypothetical protein R3A80_06700 [Bdellovibrionota bacterium]